MAVILSLPLNNSYHIIDALKFGLVIVLIQFTIGASNDYFDQRLDEVTKPWKPLPSGTANSEVTKGIIFFLVLLILGLSAFFGIIIQIILLLGLGMGLTYNMGLKSTILSWLPLSLALPLLFVAARLVNGNFLMIHLWCFPISILLGPAINLSNQLTDYEAIINYEKSLISYCGSPKRAGRIATMLLIMSSLTIPVIAIINRIDHSFALITGLIGIIFSGFFFITVELDKRGFQFPIAFVITGLLATGFIISID
jgi:4-hydroxybenzoate polyprenyltransferase